MLNEKRRQSEKNYKENENLGKLFESILFHFQGEMKVSSLNTQLVIYGINAAYVVDCCRVTMTIGK